MFQTVELPLWLLILIVLFAAVTFASHFLFPSVRWFLRRRMERAVEELNKRLQRPIQPFKLATRHDTIQRLIYDPVVMEAVAKHARHAKIPENVAFQEARRYAREIVPSFSATAYFGIAIRLARYVSQSFFRVQLSYQDQEALRQIDPEATVIYVMNHRSNLDYVLVTYLAADQSALSYAVGEWANVWPLRGLIRAMGGYFIRRSSRNQLYRRILARYVQIATANGVAQAVFPEGGLSLSGKVEEPKLGLLSYVLNGFDRKNGRDVVFVPVALNYDRVLEDRVLLEAASQKQRRFRFSVFSMIGFVLRQIRFKLTGRFHQFGYAAVRFGAPLSLRSFLEGNERGLEAIGEELMGRVRQNLPALPVPLVAHVLSASEAPVSVDALERSVTELATKLDELGAPFHYPDGDAEKAAQVGLRILSLRGMVVETGDGYVVNPEDADAITFYAASVAQVLNATAA
jgi:glycerol-3-phosphate O-acyltransferase